MISVIDTGIGLPPEMFGRVFDLFAQADRTLDRSEGGLGIGLTVARKLAEMHGGSVSAASEGLGRGATFTVRLPLAATARPTTTPPTAPRSAASPAALKILVVDDNHDTAATAAMLLGDLWARRAHRLRRPRRAGSRPARFARKPSSSTSASPA